MVDLTQTESGLVSRFIEKHGWKRLGEEVEKVREASAVVAAIPWLEARTVEEVIKLGKGTCTGKHLLLMAIFDELRVKYKPVVGGFVWSKQGITSPEEMRTILSESEWVHGHNFVEVEYGDGMKVDVDVTFNGNEGMVKRGFKVFPGNWDGVESITCVNLEDGTRRVVENVGEMEQMKKAMVDGLGEETKQRRRRFLDLMFEWVEGFNSPAGSLI